MAGGVKVGPINLQLSWGCKDGYVSVSFFFGSAIGRFSRNLMHWVHEEGFCDEETRDKDWINYTNLLLQGTEPIAEYERVKRILDRFFLTKTKAYLAATRPTRGQQVKVYVRGHRGAWLPRMAPLDELHNLRVVSLPANAAIVRCRWIVTSGDTNLREAIDRLRWATRAT